MEAIHNLLLPILLAHLLLFSSPMCFFFKCYGTNSSSAHCLLLCLDCTLLCLLDTLVPKNLVRYHILFEDFPDFCSELITSSFVFLLSLLPVCNCKLHVLCCNYLYLSLKCPDCVLFFFISPAPSTGLGPWKVLNKCW